MEVFISMGIDGKHGFEDKIHPIESVHREFGERIALIGGVDVSLLTTGPEVAIRRRAREILESCGPEGGSILGIRFPGMPGL